LKAFGKVEYQRAISNQLGLDPISNETGSAGDYNGTTVSGGVRWEF
jgi:hypothetical protein